MKTQRNSTLILNWSFFWFFLSSIIKGFWCLWLEKWVCLNELVPKQKPQGFRLLKAASVFPTSNLPVAKSLVFSFPHCYGLICKYIVTDKLRKFFKFFILKKGRFRIVRENHNSQNLFFVQDRLIYKMDLPFINVGEFFVFDSRTLYIKKYFFYWIGISAR